MARTAMDEWRPGADADQPHDERNGKTADHGGDCMMALAASVAGCGTSKMTTGSIGRASGKAVETMSAGELHKRDDRAGQILRQEPQRQGHRASNYSAVLQMNGDADQSLAVMRKLAIALPKDRDVLAAYGKALAGNRRVRAGARCGAPGADAGISGLEAGVGRSRHPRPARPDGRSAPELPQGAWTSSRTNRRSCPISACPTCWKAICARPKPICARPPSSRAPTAASARTWRWWSGCRAASRRPRRSPRQELSPEQAQANVTYLRRCWPSRTPGTSSRTRTRQSLRPN